MTVDCEPHSRRSIRLKGYDYAQPGAYFVTLMAYGRRCTFGRVEDGQVLLSRVGAIAANEWERTAALRSYVELDAFVVMPNHLHGIVIIRGDGEATGPVSRLDAPASQPPGRACQPALAAGRPGRHAPTNVFASGSFRAPLAGSLAAIVNHFKGSVTKQTAQLTDGLPLWQRGFYEHVIRDEVDLARIRLYIDNNPSRWADDVENPAVVRAGLSPARR